MRLYHGISTPDRADTTGVSPTGGQQASTGNQGGQQPDIKFENHLPNEVLTVLRDVQRLETLAEWCSDRCLEMGGQQIGAARRCRDIADFAHLGIHFVSRNPDRQMALGQFIPQYFGTVRQELAQYQSAPVRQTVETLDRSIASMQQVLATQGQMAGQQRSMAAPQQQ